MIPKFNTYARQLASKYCIVIKIWHSPYWNFMVRYNSWRVKIIWELFLDIRTESDQVMFLTNKKILTSLRWSNFGSFHLPAHKPSATVTTFASRRFAFQTDGRPPGNRFKRRSLNNGCSNCRHRWEGVTTAPARLWGRHCSTTELPTDRYLTTDHLQTGVACAIQLFCEGFRLYFAYGMTRLAELYTESYQTWQTPCNALFVLHVHPSICQKPQQIFSLNFISVTLCIVTVINYMF